jgi:serine/threonine protein kinase
MSAAITDLAAPAAESVQALRPVPLGFIEVIDEQRRQPGWTGPEQMRSTRDVDARADIWSLGCILFALLDGAPPFRGDTALAVFERILEGVPPLKRPDAPPGLVAALNQSLAKDPARRFSDVNAFCSALGPFASSQGQRSVEWVRALAARSGTPPGGARPRFGAPARPRAPRGSRGEIEPRPSPPPAASSAPSRKGAASLIAGSP